MGEIGLAYARDGLLGPAAAAAGQAKAFGAAHRTIADKRTPAVEGAQDTTYVDPAARRSKTRGEPLND